MLVSIFLFSGCGQSSQQDDNALEEEKNSVSCKALQLDVSKKGFVVDLEDAQKRTEEYVQGVLGYNEKLGMEDACTYDLYNSFMFDANYPTIMDFDKSDAEIHVGFDIFAEEYNIENLDILYELLRLERVVMNQSGDMQQEVDKDVVVKTMIASSVDSIGLCGDGYVTKPKDGDEICRDYDMGVWPSISKENAEWGGCDMKINRVDGMIREFEYCATLSDGRVGHCNEKGCIFE